MILLLLVYSRRPGAEHFYFSVTLAFQKLVKHSQKACLIVVQSLCFVRATISTRYASFSSLVRVIAFRPSNLRSRELALWSILSICPSPSPSWSDSVTPSMSQPNFCTNWPKSWAFRIDPSMWTADPPAQNSSVRRVPASWPVPAPSEEPPWGRSDSWHSRSSRVRPNPGSYTTRYSCPPSPSSTPPYA